MPCRIMCSVTGAGVYLTIFMDNIPQIFCIFEYFHHRSWGILCHHYKNRGNIVAYCNIVDSIYI